ncbi:LOB domain-containing protein [Artemisia annua]|uniref:LOB domain-containing protein n=1 Tax=Artemisia annua TaxID=35608 RepID=A0A2U1MZI0_ARTAN|nr:LOB domain-containing protein [Artemisia annua]
MTSTRCAVCKYFRRRCPPECIFAPYFPADNPQKFAYVHRFYGASNISKMLEELPVHLRANAIESLCYEAKCRMQDPVYGCVRIISSLHQELHIAQSQLAKTQAEIALLNACVGVVEPTPSSSESLVQQNGIDHGLDNASEFWFY